MPRRAANASLAALLLAAAHGCRSEPTALSAPPKAAACASCHAQGPLRATAPMNPVLVGQHAIYLSTQLQAFRDGRRKHPIMQAMAAGLSDDEIDALAAYYQSLGATPYRLGDASE